MSKVCVGNHWTKKLQPHLLHTTHDGSVTFDPTISQSGEIVDQSGHTLPKPCFCYIDRGATCDWNWIALRCADIIISKMVTFAENQFSAVNRQKSAAWPDGWIIFNIFWPFRTMNFLHWIVCNWVNRSGIK